MIAIDRGSVDSPGTLTDVPGTLLGHDHSKTALTGCSVVIFPRGAIMGVAVVGSATGSREITALSPWGLVERVHGLVLAGGSAFGLAAVTGAVRFLEEAGIGFPVGRIGVPVVPAAVIFDLTVGKLDVRPDDEMGYQAARRATDNATERGSVGAGMGATMGKALGMEYCMRGGLGMASDRTPGGAVVSALAVVNAYGDVVDSTGRIIAGTRDPSGTGFLDSERYLARDKGRRSSPLGRNTTLGLVATDALLSKPEVWKVAQMAAAGLYRSVRPAGTMVDGDMIFSASTGKKKEKVDIIGIIASKVISDAIVDAILNAESVPGIPAHESFVTE